MRWRSRRAVSPHSFLLAVALTFLGACGVVESGPNYRYRLTVEVDTPQGLRSGSSVIAVKCGAVRLPAVGGAGCHARGEAVAVDLPDGRTLFALTRGEHNPDLINYLASSAVMPTSTDADSLTRDEQWRRRAAFLAQPREVPRTVKGGPIGKDMVDNYPVFATFADIGDPASIRAVNPDALDNEFGAGVKLKRITVQVTEDNVTKKIKKRLPWLPNMYENLPVDFAPEGIPLGDMQRLFTTESFQ